MDLLPTILAFENKVPPETPHKPLHSLTYIKQLIFNSHLIYMQITLIGYKSMWGVSIIRPR